MESMQPPFYTAEILAAYLAACKRRGARDSTLKRYRSLGKALSKAAQLLPVTPDAMSELTGKLRRKYAPNTVNTALTVLHSAVKHARISDAAPVIRVKVRRPLPTTLDSAAQARLLAVVQGQRLELAVLLALDAGLRHGEILKLQWRHFVDGKVVVVDPKNYQDREVPMTQRLAAAVRSAEQQAQAGLAPWQEKWQGLKWHPEQWVFASSDVERVRPRKAIAPGHLTSLAGYLDRAHEKAETGATGFHVLRRTWATRLGSAGAPLPTIMRLGGWASLAVAQRYVTSEKATEAAAIAALEV